MLALRLVQAVGKDTLSHLSQSKACLYTCLLSQVVADGAVHAIVLKFLPLRVAQLLSKCGLLIRYSPFLHASTQSLAEVLQQLGASPELKAVLSYIFPTYGMCWLQSVLLLDKRLLSAGLCLLPEPAWLTDRPEWP